jgi:hypothetical protein
MDGAADAAATDQIRKEQRGFLTANQAKHAKADGAEHGFEVLTAGNAEVAKTSLPISGFLLFSGGQFIAEKTRICMIVVREKENESKTISQESGVRRWKSRCRRWWRWVSGGNRDSTHAKCNAFRGLGGVKKVLDPC